jgi:hypothetical protein
MSYRVYLVDDPVEGPTHAQKTNKWSKVRIRSMGYKKGDPAPAFTLVFDQALDGNFSTGDSTPAEGNVGIGKVTFKSVETANKKYQEVVINLSGNAHPDEGYKYSVTMGANTWDPRMVPR